MIIHGVEFNKAADRISLVKFRKRINDGNDELEKYFAKMRAISNKELDEIYESLRKNQKESAVINRYSRSDELEEKQNELQICCGSPLMASDHREGIIVLRHRQRPVMVSLHAAWFISLPEKTKNRLSKAWEIIRVCNGKENVWHL